MRADPRLPIMPRMLLPTSHQIAAILRVALAAAGFALAVPAAAHADSLVYVKAGDVWLAHPDGSGEYRVTEGGGYRSPSMSDDGTIVAVHGAGDLVRMRQNGEVLSRFQVIGSGPHSGSFEGPFDPQVSPDGRHVAYWFIQRSSYYDPNCQCEVTDTRPHATITAADRFTDPTNREAGAYRAPSWIGTHHRLLVADYAQVGTYVAGGDNSALQRWYNDYQRAWAIARLELTRDLSKLVVAHGDHVTNPTRLMLYTTNGRPWTDDGPPYDNHDPNRPKPPAPTPACALDRGQPISGVSWSTDGAKLAFGQPDGIWVADVPAQLTDCAAIAGGLRIAGAAQPDFSPAPIAPGARPAPGGGAGSGGGGTTGGSGGTTAGSGQTVAGGPTLASARLDPARFRRRRGAKLHVAVSGPVRLSLVIRRGRRVVRRLTAEASPSRSVLRFRPGKLRPGRYTLTIVARDGAGRTSAAQRARFQVVAR